MKAALTKFCRLFRPIAFRGYELLIMRALMALVVLRVVPGGTSYQEQPHPVGLARWLGIDFTFLSNPSVYDGVMIALYVALAVYCTGWFLWAALPVILGIVVAVGTLEGSQGAHQHSTQIVALCLLAQCAWHVFAAITGRSRVEGEPTREGRLEVERLSVWFTQQTIAAAYIVSALSKWVAKGDWIRDSSNFPLQIIKSQRMDYYNRLEAPAASGGDYGFISDLLRPVASWLEHTMITHPAWAPMLLAPGFLLELFAFMLLAGRVIGGLFAALLIVFHLTIAEMMGLNFKFNIYLLVIFFLSVPFWFELAGRKGLALARGRGEKESA